MAAGGKKGTGKGRGKAKSSKASAQKEPAAADAATDGASCTTAEAEHPPASATAQAALGVTSMRPDTEPIAPQPQGTGDAHPSASPEANGSPLPTTLPSPPSPPSSAPLVTPVQQAEPAPQAAPAPQGAIATPGLAANTAVAGRPGTNADTPARTSTPRPARRAPERLGTPNLNRSTRNTGTASVTSFSDILSVHASSSEDEGEAEVLPVRDRDYTAYGRMYCRLGEPWDSITEVIEEGVRAELELAAAMLASEPDGSDDTPTAGGTGSGPGNAPGQHKSRDPGGGSGGGAEGGHDDNPYEGGDGSEDDAERLEAIEWERRRASWTILCERIPGFRAEILALAERRELRTSDIPTKLQEGRSHARSDDTSSLKIAILRYIHQDSSIPLTPALSDTKSKALRGWKHEQLAHLLLPLQYTANVETLLDIEDGTLEITADDWPRFLYPDGRAYNPNDEFTDIFRGHLLLRVVKHIFTGPGTWNMGPGEQKGKPSIAKLIGMTSITSRAIAYAAVQARFAICGSQDWSAMDRDFDHEEFYWNVVAAIDLEPDQATIKYFNGKLFTAKGAKRRTRASAVDRLVAQRKRARMGATVAVNVTAA
ncbi:hypothetical protein K474DRAFT_1776724 [Panus rudis PR-1116 ss-1]|nr:hypothetical protein K474DRAFT_1776724 [Panus rudis PR-1116 ss-1]